MEVFQSMYISINICIYMCLYYVYTNTNKKKIVGPIHSSLLPLSFPWKNVTILYILLHVTYNKIVLHGEILVQLLCPWNWCYIFWVWFSFTYISAWVGRHPILSIPVGIHQYAKIQAAAHKEIKCSKRRHLHWLFSYAEYKRLAFLFLDTPQKL